MSLQRPKASETDDDIYEQEIKFILRKEGGNFADAFRKYAMEKSKKLEGAELLDAEDKHVTVMLEHLQEREPVRMEDNDFQLPASISSQFTGRPIPLHRTQVLPDLLENSPSTSSAQSTRPRSLFAQQMGLMKAKRAEASLKAPSMTSPSASSVKGIVPPDVQPTSVIGSDATSSSFNQVFIPHPSKIISGEGLCNFGNVAAQEERNNIHRQNLALLNSLSRDKIESERQELLSTIDPKILAFIRKRSTGGGSSNSSNDHSATLDDSVSKSQQQKRLSSPNESKTPIAKDKGKKAKFDVAQHTEYSKQRKSTNSEFTTRSTEDREFDINQLPVKPSEKIPHLNRVEKDKLAWMMNVKMPSESIITQTNQPARFDFRGLVIPLVDSYTISDKALYHHGDEPERGGYTPGELFTLCRSAHSPQRCLALTTLANILRRTRDGSHIVSVQPELAGCLLQPLLESGIPFLFRWCLDEALTSRSAAQLTASLDALEALLCWPTWEQDGWDILNFDWPSSLGLFSSGFVPSLSPHVRWPHKNDQSTLNSSNPVQMCQEETQLSDVPDFDCMLSDPLWTLVKRCFLLQRIAWMLRSEAEVRSYLGQAPLAVQHLLDILVVTATHSECLSQEIYQTRNLLAQLFKFFLPLSNRHSTDNGSDIDNNNEYVLKCALYTPMPLAMKLARVLCQSSKTLALSLNNSHRIFERCLFYLNRSTRDLCLPEDMALALRKESIHTLTILCLYGIRCEQICGLLPIWLMKTFNHLNIYMNSLERATPQCNSFLASESEEQFHSKRVQQMGHFLSACCHMIHYAIGCPEKGHLITEEVDSAISNYSLCALHILNRHSLSWWISQDLKNSTFMGTNLLRFITLTLRYQVLEKKNEVTTPEKNATTQNAIRELLRTFLQEYTQDMLCIARSHSSLALPFRFGDHFSFLGIGSSCLLQPFTRIHLRKHERVIMAEAEEGRRPVVAVTGPPGEEKIVSDLSIDHSVYSWNDSLHHISYLFVLSHSISLLLSSRSSINEHVDILVTQQLLSSPELLLWCRQVSLSLTQVSQEDVTNDNPLNSFIQVGLDVHATRSESSTEPQPDSKLQKRKKTREKHLTKDTHFRSHITILEVDALCSVLLLQSLLPIETLNMSVRHSLHRAALSLLPCLIQGREQLALRFIKDVVFNESNIIANFQHRRHNEEWISDHSNLEDGIQRMQLSGTCSTASRLQDHFLSPLCQRLLSTLSSTANHYVNKFLPQQYLHISSTTEEVLMSPILRDRNLLTAPFSISSSNRDRRVICGSLFPTDWSFYLPCKKLSNYPENSSKTLSTVNFLPLGCLLWITAMETLQEDQWCGGLSTVDRFARCYTLLLLYGDDEDEMNVKHSNDIAMETNNDEVSSDTDVTLAKHLALSHLLKKFSQVCYKDVGFDLEQPLSVSLGWPVFYDLFIEVVKHYQGVSYGDPMFANWVIIPCMQQNHLKYRRALWSEYQLALRVITLPLTEVSFPIACFIDRDETDSSLLSNYWNSLFTGIITRERNPLPYLIAVHHLNRFLYENLTYQQQKVHSLQLQVSSASSFSSADEELQKKILLQCTMIKRMDFMEPLLSRHLLYYSAVDLQSPYGLGMYVELPSLRKHHLQRIKQMK